MPLMLKRERDGSFRPQWYGVFSVNGKRTVRNLELDWFGTPPVNLNHKGDEKFEISRKQAAKELARLRTDANTKGRAEHLMQRLIKDKTGREPVYVKLTELPDKWRNLSRETPPSEAWLAWCDHIFRNFAQSAKCTYLYEVTPDHTSAFINALKKTRTAKTVKDVTTLLRSAFTYFLPIGVENPLGKTIRRKKARSTVEGGMAARRPLTLEQLETLFETARPDPFTYPLVVCAACTGMRIGDVCRLRWQSVDMKHGWIRVATSKTGAEIEVPLFARLLEVLQTALANKSESPYVWPDAARMYEHNLTGITYRGKVLFAKAFAEPERSTSNRPVLTSGRVDLKDVLPQVTEAVKGAGFAYEKRDRILDTLTRYGSGESYRAIQNATGRARSVTSEDLAEAEEVSELHFRKGSTEKTGRDLKSLIKGTRQKRSDGRLSASLLGWHNLRGTFVVLALNEGIPFETVAKCTGHTTAKTVRDHYYNPTREHTRQAMRRVEAQISGRKRAARASSPHVEALAKKAEGLTVAERKQLAAMLA